MHKYFLLVLGSIYLSFHPACWSQIVKKTNPIIGKTKASRLLSRANIKKTPSSSKELTRLHGQFNLTSNYIFRGISQTKNYPAAQGGASYTLLENGLYVGGWASNAFFVDEFNHSAYIEIDPSIGISKQVTKEFSYDLSLVDYVYPGVFNTSYPEFNAYLTYQSVNVHFAYSNDVYAVGQAGTYYSIGFNRDIPSHYVFNLNDVRFTASIGYSDLPQNKGLHSYQDYSVTLSKLINTFVYTFQWTDTNGRSTDNHAFKNSLVAIMVGRNF